MVSCLAAAVLLPALLALPVQDDESTGFATVDGDELVIHFDEVHGTPLEDFIKLCEIQTGRQLTFSQYDVKDVRLRFMGQKRLHADQFWAYFQAILKAHDFLVVPYGHTSSLLQEPDEGFFAVRRTSGGAGGGAKPGYIKSQAPVVTREQLEAFRSDSGIVLTTSFTLRHVNVQEAMNMLQTYFTDPMVESVRAVGNTNSLVATGFAQTLWGIDQLINLIDLPPTPSAPLKFARIELKHAVAIEVTEILVRMVSPRQVPGRQAYPTNLPAHLSEASPRIDADARTNSVVVLAAPDTLKQIADYIQQLDIRVEPPQGRRPLETCVVRLKHADAAGLAATLRQWSESVRLSGHVSVIPETRSNSLLVTAGDEQYAQIQGLIEKLDVELPDGLEETSEDR